MAKRKKHYAEDGWAIWVDGDDTSKVYMNDWLNPKGKSYMDLAVSIMDIKLCPTLHVYVPFRVTKEEVVDVSRSFEDKNILYATFGSACIVDFMKNEHTSEIAYNGKTVDVVHISTFDFEVKELGEGTLIEVDLDQIRPFCDNDNIYLIWRMPHRSLDLIFKPRADTRKFLERLRDLVTTPVRSEKYGYSIRINEARLLPEEINRFSAIHRQKISKAVISISLSEDYEINDNGCYRIRRLEENLYKDYLPKDYNRDDVITYQWNRTREHNPMGHYSFYFTITRESIGKASMLFYIILLVIFGVAGEAAYELIRFLVGLFL